MSEIIDREFREKLGGMWQQGLIKENVEERLCTLANLDASVTQWRDDPQLAKLLQLFQAFANKNRLLILLLINQGVKCSCEIEKLLNLTQSTVSHHITILVNVGAISIEKVGKWSLIKTKWRDFSKEMFIQMLNEVFS